MPRGAGSGAAIYDSSVDHLRDALQASSRRRPKRRPHVRACYPFVRVHTDTVARADSRLSYGFVAGPGTFETTLTRPDLFARYYLEQFRLLLENHHVALEVGTSTQPIPVHFSLAEHDHIEGSLTAERRLLMRDRVRPARPGRHGRRHRQRHLRAAAPASRSRWRCSPRRGSTTRCTGCATTPAPTPEHFQNFVLFTNYQFYIDEFVRLGHELMAATADGAGRTRRSSSPATWSTRRAGRAARPGDELGAPPPRLPQMPAYHLVRRDGSGITMVNIGVGPANAKTITDHIAVLRPHAWIMLGHCAGLRNTQQLGDYVLAHGYVREDHVLDEDLPLWVPIPALAEVQVALEAAVAEITQLKGYELKRIMRTGTVASTDNRNWELLPSRNVATTPERRFSQSRAIALDMESATIAANGFRFRVPYGTLLCVSDKPLHGEIKLPGMANHFYRERVDQHLRIGIRAIELLARARRRPAAQPQAAQLRRGGVPVVAFAWRRRLINQPLSSRPCRLPRATWRRFASTTPWRCSTTSSVPLSSSRMPPPCAAWKGDSPSGCRSSRATGARSSHARGRSASGWRGSSSS